METSDVKNRLLLLARERLRHRPFELDALETDLLLSSFIGSPLSIELLMLHLSKAKVLASMGVRGAVDRELINIIDRWATARESVSVEPLPPGLRLRIAAPKVVRPPAVGIAQRNRILQLLRNAGYEPKALPARPPGKAGVKAAIKPAAVAEKNLFSSGGVFDTVWQILRDEGEIQG